MPELPEVETVRNTLKNFILNETITKVNVYYDGIIKSDLNEFKNILINETLTDILRYGKYLIFVFNHVSIISHLRMEGKFFVKNINDPVVKHEHVEFVFESGKVLRYHDTRKFGTMKIVKATDFASIMKDPELAKLAKEANDESFDALQLYNNLSHTDTAIKTMILSQDVICGLGNIYADEVLFRCKLNPSTPSKEITLEDCENILSSSRVILAEAIKCGGTTIRSYTSSLGVTGRFQQQLKCHCRENEKCYDCGDTILKTVVGGRGTYFCPTCQKYTKTIYGLTGSIGTGKSTVLAEAKKLGFYTIDCDIVVHYLYTKPEVKKVLKGLFGDSIIVNNEVDLKQVSKLIYTNNYLKQQLESYIHPLVKKVIKYQCDITCNKNIMIEIPLLFEAHFEDICDKIICVNVPHQLQVERLMKRNNMLEEQAKYLISKQMPLEEKIKLSDIIIDNTGDENNIIKQLKEIL